MPLTPNQAEAERGSPALQSVHFDVAGTDAGAEEIELDVRMIGQERHRHRGIRNLLGNHQCGKPLTEWIVVSASLPNRDLLRFPGFQWSNGNCFCWHEGNVSA